MDRVDRIALGWVGASLPVRLILAGSTDLSPDEAYYVSVGRLGLRFDDHPPLVTWLASAFTWLPAPLELGVRLPSLLLGTVLGCLAVTWVRDRGGDGTAQRWAAILSCWYALPMAGGFLMTPDMPMLVCTALLLWWIERFEGSPALRFVVPFAATCLGMLAKVSMLVPAVIAIATTRRHAERVAVAAGIACALPPCWRSLMFQVEHVFADASGGESVIGLAGAAIGAAAAQLGLWGPVLVLGARGAMTRAPDRYLVLSLAGLVIVSALVRGVPPEPNWFAPAALVLIASAALAMSRAARWSRITAIVVGPVIALVFASHVVCPWMPISTRLDPSARLHGWRTDWPPEGAPGVGGYGPAAEACVYRDECDKIIQKQYFRPQ